MGHVEAKPLDPLNEGGRGRGPTRKDLDKGGRSTGHVFQQDVEDDRGATHVGDLVERDVLVNFVGGGAADTDVGASAGCHTPGEGPTIAVEHGKGPQVDWLRPHPPSDDQAECAEVGATVTIHRTLGLGRRGPRCVVEGDWVPLIRHLLRAIGRVASTNEVLVLEGAVAGARRGEHVVDDDHQWHGGVTVRQKAEGVAGHGDVLLVDEEKLGFRVTEDGGYAAGVKPRVYGVEDGCRHWHREMHLIQGRDTKDNIANNYATHHVILGDVEGLESGGKATAPFVSLPPSEREAAIDYGLTVRVNDGGPFQESQGSQGHGVILD
ncbi:oligopeptide transport ATP-binding protein OppD [Striga asiatica]|uniref:Oligopeptide transport ATP-binding protein OppD n=1 Tax=Striga asiatica TaxID=4170 RepID=A0A5A7P322_STRAF|nr:oligopeptide transport ATP-binding protein OppD [Striga asiatica]